MKFTFVNREPVSQARKMCAAFSSWQRVATSSAFIATLALTPHPAFAQHAGGTSSAGASSSQSMAGSWGGGGGGGSQSRGGGSSESGASRSSGTSGGESRSSNSGGGSQGQGSGAHGDGGLRGNSGSGGSRASNSGASGTVARNIAATPALQPISANSSKILPRVQPIFDPVTDPEQRCSFADGSGGIPLGFCLFDTMDSFSNSYASDYPFFAFASGYYGLGSSVAGSGASPILIPFSVPSGAAPAPMLDSTPPANAPPSERSPAPQAAAAGPQAIPVVAVIAVKDGLTYPVTAFWIDGHILHYAVPSVGEFTVDESGVALTNGNGYAEVNLPAYFVSLQSDFRYQLTVDAPEGAQVTASGVVVDKFVIRTDRPGVKVAWQLTKVR
jgi:hypothetical protein